MASDTMQDTTQINEYITTAANDTVEYTCELPQIRVRFMRNGIVLFTPELLPLKLRLEAVTQGGERALGTCLGEIVTMVKQFYNIELNADEAYTLFCYIGTAFTDYKKKLDAILMLPASSI